MIKINSIRRNFCYRILSRAQQAPKACRVRHPAWKPAADADDGDSVTACAARQRFMRSPLSACGHGISAPASPICPRGERRAASSGKNVRRGTREPETGRRFDHAKLQGDFVVPGDPGRLQKPRSGTVKRRSCGGGTFPAPRYRLARLGPAMRAGRSNAAVRRGRRRNGGRFR